MLLAISGPHLKDVVLEGFVCLFVCLFGVFVLFCCIFPRSASSKSTCISLGLSKGRPLEEISFERSSFLSYTASPPQPPKTLLAGSRYPGLPHFHDVSHSCLCEAGRGESAVMTSPDDETNLSGWFLFVCFSPGELFSDS